MKTELNGSGSEAYVLCFMSATDSLKLVAIGGGTGLATLLKGLRLYLKPESVRAGAATTSTSGQTEVEALRAEPRLASLTAIVTVTDDGKSSGRLREEFGVLPPGDIRNCLVALADEDQLMTRLFRHRFSGGGQLGGHSLGNLIILALSQMSGDFLKAINQARELLGIQARVLPSTLEQVDLVAQVGDKTVRGQVAIKSQRAPIHHLSLVPPDVRALPEAVEAILAADLITLGPGSLFTSVISNLLVGDLAQALAKSRAKKIYICNVMTEADETDGFTAVDHVKQVLKYGRGLSLDYALFNSSPISPEMRQRYAAEQAIPLDPPQAPGLESPPVKFIALPLASEARAVRHNPERLSRAIFEIYHGSIPQ